MKRRRGGCDNHKGKRSRTGRTHHENVHSNKPSGGNYGAIEMFNPRLMEYYKSILSNDDYEKSFASFRTSLPASVRVNRSVPLWRATRDTLHRLSLRLLEVDESSDDKVDQSDGIISGFPDSVVGSERSVVMTGAGIRERGKNENSSGAVVPWYPEGLLWQWDSLNRVAIKKDQRFIKLKEFLISEDMRGALIRQVCFTLIH